MIFGLHFGMEGFLKGLRPVLIPLVFSPNFFMMSFVASSNFISHARGSFERCCMGVFVTRNPRVLLFAGAAHFFINLANKLLHFFMMRFYLLFLIFVAGYTAQAQKKKYRWFSSATSYRRRENATARNFQGQICYGSPGISGAQHCRI